MTSFKDKIFALAIATYPIGFGVGSSSLSISFVFLLIALPSLVNVKFNYKFLFLLLSSFLIVPASDNFSKAAIQFGQIFICLFCLKLYFTNSIKFTALKTISIFTALVGLLQFSLAYFSIGELNFFFLNSLYEFNWKKLSYVNEVPRIQAYFREPAHYATFLALLLPYFVNVLIFNHQRRGVYRIIALMFVTSFIFSGSIVVFLSLIIAVAVTVVQFQSLSNFLKISFVIILLISSFVSSHLFDRFLIVLDAGDLLNASIVGNDQKTIAALVINYRVTIHSLIETNGIGIGLGNHSYIFDHFILETGINNFYLNSKDGASLLLRVTSELGLLGLVCTLSLFIYLVGVARQVYRKYGLSSVSFSYVVGALTVCVSYALRNGRYNDIILWFAIFIIIRISANIKREV